MNILGMPAIVTGGASGLGAATARVLAEAGAKVSILDLNDEVGQSLASELGGFYSNCNVVDETSVKNALSDAREVHGAARILINCAGISVAIKTVSRGEPHPLDDFNRVIQVNLIGSFNCIRLAASEMVGMDPLVDGERGVIVNTASIAAYEGQIGQSAYAASKGGLVGMTLPIARDLASHGIRVCTIAPGLFLTPLLENDVDEDIKASLEASIPFPSRLGQTKEFGHLAQHIIENIMLNGETIRIDGALRMAPR